MKVTVLLFGLLVIFGLTHSAYVLDSTWAGNTFFNGWNFFTAGDPTHGTVDYVTQSVAQQKGYIGMKGSSVYIGCDMDTVVSTKVRGRQSVRINTQKTFNSGLFIIDLEHMPAGCSTWPAFWTVGPNWPNMGEIDIIEGVNTHTVDSTTLHTSNGCSMAKENPAIFSGTWANGTHGPATNCFVNAPGQANNQGCGIVGLGSSYGTPFNAGGGGVYATEWNSTLIRMYFWPRSRIPADITTPDPSTWGKPYAWFTLGPDCPASKFQQHVIVINLTFCGDWAGNVFGSDCPSDGNCANFVRNTPTAFKEAYWLINYVSVYQNH